MFNRRAKTIAKIEKTLLKAKKRNPVFFDEDKDSFMMRDISSNIVVKLEDKDQHLVDEEEQVVIDAYKAMSLIGKNGYHELISYLYEFLEDSDEYLREKAIFTFGEFTANQLPGLEEKLLIIWSNEAEKFLVRTSALGVWGGFHRNTHDKNIIKLMYHLLKTKQIDFYLRYRAFMIILDVIDEGTPFYDGLALYNKLTKLYTIDGYSEDEFNATFDWEKVNSIMKKYAPEELQSE